MQRISMLFVATVLVVPACGGSETAEEKPAPAPAADKTAEAPAAPDEAAAQEEPPAPEAPTADALAQSGVPVGGKMKAFDIINCDSGELYCQVCRYGPAPKMMAVGSPDDADFKKDLQAFQALADKIGEDKVKAFAVVTDKKDGQFMPLADADADAMKARAAAIKKELGLTMPVVVPAAKDEDGNDNTAFIEHYKVTASRTVMFANGKNEVKYSAVAPRDMTELEQAILASAG